jgi:hypothetical protein
MTLSNTKTNKEPKVYLLAIFQTIQIYFPAVPVTSQNVTIKSGAVRVPDGLHV